MFLCSLRIATPLRYLKDALGRSHARDLSKGLLGSSTSCGSPKMPVMLQRITSNDPSESVAKSASPPNSQSKMPWTVDQSGAKLLKSWRMTSLFKGCKPTPIFSQADGRS